MRFATLAKTKEELECKTIQGGLSEEFDADGGACGLTGVSLVFGACPLSMDMQWEAKRDAYKRYLYIVEHAIVCDSMLVHTWL